MYDRNQVFLKKSLHIFISEKTLLTGLRNQDTWPQLHHIQVQKGNQNASVLFPPLWGVQRVAKVVHIHFLQVRLILSGRSRPRTHLLLNMYEQSCDFSVLNIQFNEFQASSIKFLLQNRTFLYHTIFKLPGTMVYLSECVHMPFLLSGTF